VNLLITLCLIPIVGALGLLLFPKDREQGMRIWTVVVSLAVLCAALVVAFQFDSTARGFQFEFSHIWSYQYGITFSLGLDGLSLGLVLLTALLTPLSLLVSWNSIKERVRVFLISFLLLETGLIGVFISLDLIVFYIFWEVVLIPMYFIIGMWGHEDRVYATTKFVLYTKVS